MPKVLILYHFYSPDDVVSAQIFSGLAEGLARETEPSPDQPSSAQSWQVEVWPGNRSSHHENEKYGTTVEMLAGVKVARVWRPALRQHSFLGRIFNSIWMQKAWAWRLLLNPSYKPDIIIIGTDPIFSVGLSTSLKFLRPKAKLVHWCFDLYPEAAVADGIMGTNNPLVKLLKYGLKRAYKKCDLVVDLGPCMREKLEAYGIGKEPQTTPLEGEGKKRETKMVTLTPWALEEPSSPLPFDSHERSQLFGHSHLGLLYSGTLGRAHDFYLTLKLARLMRLTATFCYSARGGRLAELNKAVNPEDYNVRFVPFADQKRLAIRLSSPDIHLVSLRQEWSGTVVPSKFFGALAIGRPVLFEGDPQSSIARWIEEFKVGWVLKADNLAEITKALTQFSDNEKERTAMFKRCHKVYQENFSKKIILDRWDKELRTLINS